MCIGPDFIWLRRKSDVCSLQTARELRILRLATSAQFWACPWVVERVNVVQSGGAQQSEEDGKANAPSGTTKPPDRLD